LIYTTVKIINISYVFILAIYFIFFNIGLQS